jgi:very-short-patch-repair endonuclease
MPPKRSNPQTMHRAGELRREPTPAEGRLWAYLRGNRLNGVSFRRQHAIGNYIVDFCAPRQKLVIELDGSQHLEQAEYDAERTVFLESQGYRVLRFWNNDVMNDLQGVIRAIQVALEEG